jgi:hypothetical protein
MNVTPEEEEAWVALERKMVDNTLRKAVEAAYEFTKEAGQDLGIFTLRKAYEMGYIRGYNARGKE